MLAEDSIHSSLCLQHHLMRKEDLVVELRLLPTVKEVRMIADLLPGEQTGKLQELAKLREVVPSGIAAIAPSAEQAARSSLTRLDSALRNIETADDVSGLAFEISANGVDPADAAKAWVEANSDRVDAMLGL